MTAAKNCESKRHRQTLSYYIRVPMIFYIGPVGAMRCTYGKLDIGLCAVVLLSARYSYVLNIYAGVFYLTNSVRPAMCLRMICTVVLLSARHSYVLKTYTCVFYLANSVRTAMLLRVICAVVLFLTGAPTCWTSTSASLLRTLGAPRPVVARGLCCCIAVCQVLLRAEHIHRRLVLDPLGAPRHVFARDL